MKTPLRVLHLLDTDQVAGTEKHVLTLMSALAGEGVTTLLGCRRGGPLEKAARDQGCAVLPIFGGGYATSWRLLQQALRAHRIDILHAHNGRMMLAGALTSMKTGIPSVATQHFLQPNHTTQRGLQALLANGAHRWVSRKTRHFIAISEAARAGMLARGEVPAEKITVVPNGLSVPEAHALTPPAHVRAAWDIAPDAPLVISVARLEREKDVASLVAAMAEVTKSRPEAVCIVAGEGAQREALSEQIAALHVQRQVRLIGFQRDVLSLINACDLFVLSSLQESFGLVLLEAMSACRPIVATRAGGPQEIVIPEETGLLVPLADPHALAQAILRLLSNPPLAQAMGCAGFQRLQERFTAPRMAQATRAVYEKARDAR